MTLSQEMDDKLSLLQETNKKISILPPLPMRSTDMKRSTSNLSANSKGSHGSSQYSGCNPKTQHLEELAEAFQKHLEDNNMIQDRKVKATRMMPAKVVSKCFVGEDAVTVLQQLLTDQQKRLKLAEQQLNESNSSLESEGDAPTQTPTTEENIAREDAVKAGNEMIKLFSFFKHANHKEAELQDSATEFYQFDHNLPGQVRSMKRQYPSYWDKMRLLEQHVQVKDRRHLLRTFPNCFVASEAVDALMSLKLVKSRKEAVHLVRKLNEKVHCCEHVCNEHEFEDTFLYFQFIPPQERMPEPAKKTTKSKSPKRSHRKKLQRARTWDETMLGQQGGSSSRKLKGATDDALRDSSTTATTVSPSPSPKASPKSSPKSEREIKRVNQKRADEIKQRLADYKQDLMTPK